MTRRNRLQRRYKAEFRFGFRFADRLHVSASNVTVIRACWRILAKGKGNLSRNQRDARHAFYLGAIAGHEANRDIFTRYHF